MKQIVRGDRFYLEWALMLAKQAFSASFSPVGAIVVNEDIPITYYASSKREIGNILHAEYLALSWAHNEPVELGNFTLYSTLEPCIMCSGMATVMKAARIAWLVDDLWAGANRVYNPDNGYIQKRFPRLDKVDLPDLHREAIDMWVKYLRATGHSDAVEFMLGLPEDYKCK